MRYNEQINLKLYKYTNGTFQAQAIIDDYQEISFEHNLYEAGTFTITINYNIPNALKFERGMFIQFGNDPYMFGEILTISDAIGEDGKGSQIRTITGKDARYIFKRRVIRNLNNEENWVMTDKGEICLRSLIASQCGTGAESKRQLPVANTIPLSQDALGKEYSVAEAYSNLYDTLVTIATQSEIGWRIKFDGTLTLEVYQGADLSEQVQFSTTFDSLSNGEFTDSSESYANTVYVAGKGTGSDRDIYEGEQEIEGASPSGLDRFEAYDNQSQMTSESEYEAEALSMLTQYGQTINVSGQGLAKCPYIFKEQYDIGDTITLAFSGKSAKAQILSVTEHWTWGVYNIQFSFGKPQNDLSRQLQLILKQIQKASNKTTTTSSLKYYTIPTDTSMPKADVIYDTIGFTGACASGGSTFTLYFDSEKTGAKTYHVYFKQLGGGKLTLTTGVSGKANLVLNSGTYVAIIYVDQEGNVTSQGATATSTIEAGNTQPATSGGVASAISSEASARDTAIANSIATNKYGNIYSATLGTSGWYKIATFQRRNVGSSISIDLITSYFYQYSSSHHIQINYGWVGASVVDYAKDTSAVFDKIKICYNSNNTDDMALYVHYNKTQQNGVYLNINADTVGLTPQKFLTDSLTWENTLEFNLGTEGEYINSAMVATRADMNNPIIDTFANQTASDRIVHLGSFTPTNARQIGLIVEVDSARADNSSKIIASVGGANINALYIPTIGITWSSEIFLYRTSDYRYDLYLKISSWSKAFVKMTSPVNFTYDGITVSSYTGSKVTGQYTTLPIT